MRPAPVTPPACAAAPPAAGPSPLARILFVVALLAFGLHAALGSTMAVDLWMAMACGRAILQGRALPAGDVFSYTYAGAPWFNGEWLSQILLFELFRHGGGTALVVWKLAAVTACFLLAGWVAWRRARSLVFAALPVALAALVCRPYFDIRPELFLYLGTITVLVIVESYRRGGRAHLLLALPLLFALWVNLHFSFIYGLGVLGLLAASEVGKALWSEGPARSRARWLAAAVLAAVLACMLNPYGPRVFVFPFMVLDSGDVWRTGTNEWLRPVFFEEQIFNPMLFGYYFVAQGVLLALALVANPRGVDPGDALHVVVTAAMACSARRFVPLFALVSAPFAAANLAALRDGLARRGWSIPVPRFARAHLAALVCALASAYAVARIAPAVAGYREAGLFAGLTVADYFPAGAAEFLQRNPLPSRLFHLYPWGGYLMYWAPAHKVFVDGRAHLVYPGSLHEEFAAVELARRGWQDVFERWQVSLVVWPSYRTAGGAYKTVLEGLAGNPQWQRVYDDGHSAVYAHRERAAQWVDAFQRFALAYPDNRGALFFQADARLAAQQFDQARDLMRKALALVPGRSAGASANEGRLLDRARESGDPLLWFQIAFFRDVRDDAPGAREAYGTALAQGLPESHAVWARDAIARLATSETR